MCVPTPLLSFLRCVCANASPLHTTLPCASIWVRAEATMPRGVHFYHTFAIFARKGIRKSVTALCVTTSLTSAARGVATFSYLGAPGGTSREISARARVEAVMAGCSPQQRTLESDYARKGRERRPFPLSPTTQLTSLLRAASCTLTSSCANGVAVPSPSRFIHSTPDTARFRDRGGVHSFSTERATNTERALSKGHTLRAHVATDGSARPAWASVPLPRAPTPRPP